MDECATKVEMLGTTGSRNVAPLGVTVAICCHNSSRNLPATLSFLSLQVAERVEWEVLVVNNASEDDTAGIALKSWKGDRTRLRIVDEPRPGIIHARTRALDEAQYEFVCFVDDDNWVCENWVATVYKVMNGKPEVGICCGFIDAHSDVLLPEWFAAFRGAYAVTTSSHLPGDVTGSPDLPYGAGLTMRRSIWEFLRRNGFESAGNTIAPTQRKGVRAYSGDDWELCMAVRKCGWRLWREPSLRMRHCIEPRRLDWNYCRGLFRSGGASYVIGDAYRIAFGPEPSGTLGRLRENWYWQLGYVLQDLLASPGRTCNALRSRQPGNEDRLWLDGKLGRIWMLFAWNREFNSNIRRIRTAKWANSVRAI